MTCRGHSGSPSAPAGVSADAKRLQYPTTAASTCSARVRHDDRRCMASRNHLLLGLVWQPLCGRVQQALQETRRNKEAEHARRGGAARLSVLCEDDPPGAVPAEEEGQLRGVVGALGRENRGGGLTTGIGWLQQRVMSGDGYGRAREAATALRRSESIPLWLPDKLPHTHHTQWVGRVAGCARQPAQGALDPVQVVVEPVQVRGAAGLCHLLRFSTGAASWWVHKRSLRPRRREEQQRSKLPPPPGLLHGAHRPRRPPRRAEEEVVPYYRGHALPGPVPVSVVRVMGVR